MDSQTKLELREDALYAYISGFAERLTPQQKAEITISSKDAAKVIAALYFRYADEVVRPTITSGIIQHYKIIGYTELCVMRISPIEPTGERYAKEAEMLNARLALHISLAILIDWNMIDADQFTRLVDSDLEIKSFLEEHVIWLRNLDSRYYFPGFSNAQVWKLFHYLVRDRVKHI